MGQNFIPLLVLGFAGAGLLLRKRPTPVNAVLSETSTPAPALYSDLLQEIFVTAKKVEPLPPLESAANLPRGIRNNNPGNIESGDNWLGMTGSDGRFAIFSAPEYGIRAMARIFNSYRNRGKISLQDIISTWAPPNENDTANYINFVAKYSGVSAASIVQASDYPKVIAAMVQMENGQQPYTMSVIQNGVNLA